MAKRVTKASTKVLARQFQMNREVRRVACDDGSTYVFERDVDSPRWRAVRRIDRDGSVSAGVHRLPAAVRAHMDGFTRSGEYGRDGDNYWVA